MFAEERKQQIIELINRKKKVTVKDLCTRFGASPGTIRNDLADLEKHDLLSRTHGGAISIAKMSFEQKSIEKVIKHQNEKMAIARLALDMIEDGDTIALDTGSTTLELAKLLTNKQSLTVVTNDLAIALTLDEYSSATVLFIGGVIRKGFHCSVGPAAISELSDVRVDKAFLAANGVAIGTGLSTPDINTAQVKRELIRIADEVTLLCDSSKAGRTSFMRFADFSDLDVMITDSNLPDQIKQAIEEAGVRVDIAQAHSDDSPVHHENHPAT